MPPGPMLSASLSSSGSSSPGSARSCEQSLATTARRPGRREASREYLGSMARLTLIASGPPPDADEVLDAYSQVVVSVAERVTPSVANLRVERRVRGGRVLTGGGSGVVITPDGFLLTSA